MSIQNDDDLLEIYAAASEVEAQRLVLLLQEDGVEATVRATTSSSFPTGGQYLILVATSDQHTARTTIANARREGAVSDHGEML